MITRLTWLRAASLTRFGVNRLISAEADVRSRSRSGISGASPAAVSGPIAANKRSTIQPYPRGQERIDSLTGRKRFNFLGHVALDDPQNLREQHVRGRLTTRGASKMPCQVSRHLEAQLLQPVVAPKRRQIRAEHPAWRPDARPSLIDHRREIDIRRNIAGVQHKAGHGIPIPHGDTVSHADRVTQYRVEQ